MQAIKDDVLVFLNKCSEIFGSFEHDCYSLEISTAISIVTPIESPIEQLFYCAFRTLCAVNVCEEIELIPQKTIGKYRVDFYISYGDQFGRTEKKIIIECDSQQFHDRTETERRYEKIRDRFFQSKDYKVFHFTGKEIKDTPFHTAAEVLAYLKNRPLDEILYSDYIQE